MKHESKMEASNKNKICKHTPAAYIASRLTNSWTHFKYGVAYWLEGKFSHYNRKKAKAVLFLSSLSAGVLMTVGILQGMRHQVPDFTRISRVYRESRDINERRANDRSEGKIQRALEYIDSLKTDANGRAVYDSLVLARPGLIDSLLYVDQMQINDK